MKKLYTIFLLLIQFLLPAQNEFSKWYFGFYAGLDFATSPPTALNNGVLTTTEGVATISDNAGNLLFYTDGVSVVNSTHVTMANGLGLSGHGSSTQSAIIVKKPGSDSLYYIFTTHLANATGMRYSIVDMSLAAGLGSVTVKNATLYPYTCEKQVAVRHCNGKDVWIVTHHYGTNEFRAYLLNSAGLSVNSVTSSIGISVNNSFTSIGEMKISPDGKKLAVATLSNVASNPGVGAFHLFDFDASAGTITNSLSLLTTTFFPVGCGPYGVEFSPDGSKLYGTITTNMTYSCALFQWNVCAPTASAIVASQFSISIPNVNVGTVQRAIDNKIYLVMGSTSSLSVINNPNASGAAMNFSLNAIALDPNSLCGIGLPNYINGYTHTLPSLFTNTLNCQNSSFSVPPVPTFSAGCSATPYTPGSYLWDFGEPSSGALNTSTLANPSHYYGSIGTYTTTLIIYSNCINDTLKKVVNITVPGPAISVAGNSVICKGERYTYTVSGASSYAWSNGSAISTTTFAPTTTTVLSVTGSSAGCTTTKTFSITVNPCTGISSVSDKAAFSIFPNPFKDQLFVEAAEASELVITNLNGVVVLKSKLSEGKNEISTSELKAGVYLVQAGAGEMAWRSRFVKE